MPRAGQKTVIFNHIPDLWLRRRLLLWKSGGQLDLKAGHISLVLSIKSDANPQAMKQGKEKTKMSLIKWKKWNNVAK